MISQTEPNPIDDFGPENRAAYDRLVTTLATAKPVILFAGAGLSMRVGYPSWRKLIDSLKECACTANPADAARLQAMAQGDDKLTFAAELKTALGESAFGDFVSREFGPRVPPFDEVYTSLLSLPLRHVVTTNYDPALASAHESAKSFVIPAINLESFAESMQFIDNVADPNTQMTLVYLHGSISSPANVVLTLNDYNRLYIKDPRGKHFLDILFTIHTILFVGFSMTDADLMGRFRDLGAILGTGEPKHFAFIESPGADKLIARRAELRRRYRIEPIFYDPRDCHALLGPVTACLLADVRNKMPVGPAVLKPIVSEALAGSAKDRPEVVEDVSNRLSAAITARRAPLAIIDGDRTADAAALDSEINTTFQLVERGIPDAAITQYEAIIAREGSGLAPKLKYRLHANLGNARYSMNDRDGAIAEYLKAVSYYKDSPTSRGIEVLAFYLKGEDGKAQELAAALCREVPSDDRAQSLRLRTLPQSTSFDDAEAAIPEDARWQPETCLALADLAGDRGLPDIQEKYLRAAVSRYPKWADALNALSASLIIKERNFADIDIEKGPIPKHRDRIEEAKRLLDEAIQLMPTADPSSRLAGMHLNRSVCYRLLGRYSECRADVCEAFRRAPKEPEVALAEAMEREIQGDVNGAIEAVSILPTGGDSMRRDFLLALYLAQRGQTGDSDQALALLEAWWTRIGDVEPPGYRSDIYRLSIRLLGEAGRLADARRLVEGINSASIPLPSVKGLQARLAIAEKNLPKAVELANEAGKAIIADTTWFDRRELAMLAVELQAWPLAFNVLKDIVTPTRFGIDARQLLSAAHHAREERFILTFCAALRANGVHERDAYLFEADILSRHREPDQALALLHKWVVEHPSDLEVRLTLSVYARQSGRGSFAENDPSQLPSVDSITDTHRGAAAVYVLRYGSQPITGLHFAYALWRRFPDDIVARHSLVIALHDPLAPRLSLDRPAIAGAGSAVQLAVDGEPPKWVVIEPGANPRGSLNEFSPSHPFSVAMNGLGVGASFTYAGKTHQILTIENHIIYRSNECLNSFEEQHPDNPFFRKFKVASDVAPGTDPREALGTVWHEIKRQDQRRKRLEGLHQNQLVPLSIIARKLGRTVFETVRHFAVTPSLPVRCATGNPADWNNALAALRVGSPLVLDATAVTTVYLLGLTPRLSSLPFKLVIPLSVLDELREMIVDAASTRGPRRVIGADGDQLLTLEYSAEEMAAEVKRLEGLLEALKSACEVVGGTALLSMEADARDALVDAFGPGCADAIAIASERKMALWSDDWGTASFAQRLFGVSRVWTHAVLRQATAARKLSGHEYLDALGALLAFGYTFTGLASSDVVRLLKRAEWRLDSPVGKAIHNQAVEIGAENEQNCAVYGLAIAHIWLDCESEARAREVICALLDGMGKARSGPRIARYLYRVPGNWLNMSFAKMRRFRRMLRKWRSTHQSA